MVDHVQYYNGIASGYDSLHKEEQLKKFAIVSSSGIVKSSDSLLDVGCGTGFSLDYFDVASAVGIDPADKLVEQYKQTQQSDRVDLNACSKKILVGSAEKLPFENSSFDVVVSFTAIQNFTDVKGGLREILRVGKNRFALTFLKSVSFSNKIERILREVFSESIFSIEKIEEDKDFIFIIHRKV